MRLFLRALCVGSCVPNACRMRALCQPSISPLGGSALFMRCLCVCCACFNSFGHCLFTGWRVLRVRYACFMRLLFCCNDVLLMLRTRLMRPMRSLCARLALRIVLWKDNPHCLCYCACLVRAFCVPYACRVLAVYKYGLKFVCALCVGYACDARSQSLQAELAVGACWGYAFLMRSLRVLYACVSNVLWPLSSSARSLCVPNACLMRVCLLVATPGCNTRATMRCLGVA